MIGEVLLIGVEKETGSTRLLDDEYLFSLTPPTTLLPPANLESLTTGGALNRKPVAHLHNALLYFLRQFFA
jgi:hypothetical protein